MDDFREPCNEHFAAFCGVVETFGEHFIGADEVTEEVGFTDVDTQKKGWMMGGFRCRFHGLVQMPERVLKTSHGGRVTVSSKQIRMI